MIRKTGLGRIGLLTSVIILSTPLSALAVTIPTVPVGNVGNANDLSFRGLRGGVDYAYRIGTYEVTVGQYSAFLNAVAATDTYALYDPFMAIDLNIAGIARSGASGSYSYSVIGSANKPVTYVSWYDSIRFANWLHNGQGTGDTETGAYTLGPSNENGVPTNSNSITRNVGATWFLTSENEWYKAAYHKNDGATGNYWDYPTSTDSVPYSDQPPGSDAPTQSNTANFTNEDGIANGYDDGWAVTGTTSWSGSQNYLTDVGAYSLSSSPYGTFDQGGNVWEWNESSMSAFPASGTIYQIRGGSYFGGRAYELAYDLGANFNDGGWNGLVGFRVATVPEPGTAVLAALGLVGFAAWGWRRKR